MSTVIVGVDESEHSRPALRWAARHAEHARLPVKAVMAWDLIGQHHVAADQRFDPDYSAETANEVLREIVEKTLGPDHCVTCEAVLGRPSDALLGAAEPDDLLVVGARGIGGFKGLLLGSVSRHVLHHAHCPVAVVRDDADRSWRPVVVGVNGSTASLRALEWAARYASLNKSPLVAVYAWQVPTPMTYYDFVPDLDAIATDAKRFVDTQVASLDTPGVVAQARAVQGPASSALLDAAANASVVVVGARGHAKLPGSLLGSVSDQVVHHATCPVVVVP